jgi:uncharacterized protein
LKSIHFDENVEIKMQDGVVLRADVIRPDDREKHPAILNRSLRSKKSAWSGDFLNTMEAVDAGYAIVISDIRGRHSSGGEWGAKNYTAKNTEGMDGRDTVEWIGSQSWCDGNVGMFGYSHAAGFTWQVAIENPPHLKAIASWSGGAGRRKGGGGGGFSQSAAGGALSLVTTLIWLPNEAPDMLNKMEQQGIDVTEMRNILKKMVLNPEEFYYQLPLKDAIPARYTKLRELWDMRLFKMPSSGPVKYEETYDKVMIPVSHESGWYDPVVWTEFDQFNAMRKKGGTKLARESQHMLVGPWSHSSYLLSWLGDMYYGSTATSMTGQSMVSSSLIDFFDRYLRGKNTRIPVIRYFVMGENQWKEADQWPLPQTEWQRYYLHSRGNANTAAGDGALNREQPGSETQDVFVYNPLRPVPTMGGPVLGMISGPGIMAGAFEQGSIERRIDVLCYTSGELKEDIEVTGPIQLHLFASTTARDTDFTAKLIDVYPDGKAYNIGDGLMRASGLKGEGMYELINPGQTYEYTITMGHTSLIFRKNHRIRIDVTSSNFPQFDRNMNTGNPIGEDSAGISAIQTVFHQSGQASYIDLPVIPR